MARVAADNPALDPVALFPDGSLVFTADLSFSSAITEEVSPGLRRFSLAYVRFDPMGELVDTVLVGRPKSSDQHFGNLGSSS